MIYWLNLTLVYLGKRMSVIIYLIWCLMVFINICFRRQWVREEDLAKDLKLHTKQLRRTLRYFEEEKIITRDHRREVTICFCLCISH